MENNELLQLIEKLKKENEALKSENKDLKDNSVAVCQETRIIEHKNKLDNRFLNLTNDGVLEVYEDGEFKEFKGGK